MNDADLELTAHALFSSRVLNTRQVCNAAERVDVQRGIADRLAERVTRLMAETRYGKSLSDADLHMARSSTRATSTRHWPWRWRWTMPVRRPSSRPGPGGPAAGRDEPGPRHCRGRGGFCGQALGHVQRPLTPQHRIKMTLMLPVFLGPR